MYKVTSRRIDTRRDPDSRAQIAKRFKATYASLGLTVADVGKLLHVTPRTLHNWIAGRCDIPYAAFKLLRVLLCYELPSPAWEGWHFSGGKLYTPEGRSITAHESSWWSLLVRRANSTDYLYYKNLELQQQLAAAQAGLDTHRAELATHEGVPDGGPEGASGGEALVTLHQNFTGEMQRGVHRDGGPEGAFCLRTLVTPQKILTGEKKRPLRPDFRVSYRLAPGGVG